MRKLELLIIIVALVVVTERASAADPIVYPAKGQTAEQQDRDRYECHRWAVQQTGFDPSKSSNGSSASQTTNTESRQRPLLGRGSQPNAMRGGARGAALGAVGGAIAGDAGKGAAAGAAIGGLGGAMRRRDQQSATTATASMPPPGSPGLDGYNRAIAACMTGRGYSVN